MTAQISEKLFFEGEKHAMCTNPLGDYCALGGELPRFASNCTALWRGYVGTWEIINDRLYLIELHGELESGQDADLETVFPGYGERVFAHWYSGVIRLPQGKMLEYIHMGYGSTYERDLLLEFDGFGQAFAFRKQGFHLVAVIGGIVLFVGFDGVRDNGNFINKLCEPFLFFDKFHLFSPKVVGC